MSRCAFSDRMSNAFLALFRHFTGSHEDRSCPSMMLGTFYPVPSHLSRFELVPSHPMISFLQRAEFVDELFKHIFDFIQTSNMLFDSHRPEGSPANHFDCLLFTWKCTWAIHLPSNTEDSYWECTFTWTAIPPRCFPDHLPPDYNTRDVTERTSTS